MQFASVIWAMFLDGCHKKPARRFIFLETVSNASAHSIHAYVLRVVDIVLCHYFAERAVESMPRKRKSKPQSDRQIERIANQKKYGSWRDVMAESAHLRCGGCGNHVKIKGDVTGKTCKRCGTPLSSAR